MKRIIVTEQVNASAEKIWDIVRTGDAVNEWFPIITSCNLHGAGAGAKRTCVTGDGKILEETILSVDDNNKEFILRIDKQDIMPIKNIINKLKVSEIMDVTKLEWVAEFEMMDDSMYPAVEQGLKDLYAMGIKGLEVAAMKM
jgi:hypothetical protein